MKKFLGICLFALSAFNVAQAHEDNLRLYTLDCGDIAVADMDGFSSAGDYAKTSAKLGNTCYLIRHKNGDLLWDTGLPASLVNAKPMVNGVFSLSMQKTLVEQLKDIKVTPSDIEYLSLSHSHFDHVGQASSFASATWLVSDKEQKSMFANEKSSAQFSAFKDFKRKTFTGDYDVFGDGSVIILDLAGHTAGHSALQVNLKNTGTVLLSGDLYHQAKSRELKRVPRFNHDEKTTLKSMARFEKIAKETSARVVIQHETADIKKLPKLPKYLD